MLATQAAAAAAAAAGNGKLFGAASVHGGVLPQLPAQAPTRILALQNMVRISWVEFLCLGNGLQGAPHWGVFPCLCPG